MSEFPRTTVENLSLSRLIVGTNWFFGWSHTSATDKLHDHRNRRIINMDKYCAMIRQYGMIPGLSTHVPESVVYADETNLDVGTYIQIYNAAGFLMHVKADCVHRIIWNAKHPVMTVKPPAAGRLLPLVGLGFSWGTLRDRDMVAIGTMSPDEAREVPSGSAGKRFSFFPLPGSYWRF